MILTEEVANQFTQILSDLNGIEQTLDQNGIAINFITFRNRIGRITEAFSKAIVDAHKSSPCEIEAVQQLPMNNMRAELWAKAWVAIAPFTMNDMDKVLATSWADTALKEFDDRFPEYKPIKKESEGLSNV